MSQKSDTQTYQFNSKDVTVGGHDFHLTEPHGRACINVVGVVMQLIGEPDQLMDSIRQAALSSADVMSRAMSIGFKMSMSAERFQAIPEEDIQYLLEETTDKDAAWFDEHPLSGPDLLELIAEVASILPFAGVLSQKGNLAGALVSTFTKSSKTPEKSSGNSGDGDQTTSSGAESDGSYIKHDAAPSEEVAAN